MKKALVIGAIAGPAAAWLGMVTIGGVRADNAGSALIADHGGFILHTRAGLLIETAIAGMLLAYLIAG